jgi:hypothetical protein
LILSSPTVCESLFCRTFATEFRGDTAPLKAATA